MKDTPALRLHLSSGLIDEYRHLTVIHTVILFQSKGVENMSKSLEELQREYEKNTVKLEQENESCADWKTENPYLDSGSRKQRSHRLITRGAAIESVMPEVKILTEQEFYSPDGAHCRMAAGSEHGTACG